MSPAEEAEEIAVEQNGALPQAGGSPQSGSITLLRGMLPLSGKFQMTYVRRLNCAPPHVTKD